jgi:glucosamine kinase
VDSGKTSCRVALVGREGTVAQVDRTGIPAHDTGKVLVDTIVDAIRALPTHLTTKIVAAGVGAAGMLTQPDDADSIARALREALGVPTSVMSDAISAHLGAFNGQPGVVLVAGTGAVAVGIDRTGGLLRIDGLGPEIGDLGSGAWIGRNGIDAAAGLPPLSATLRASLETLTGGQDLRLWVECSPNRARTLARFAPAVLDAASHGDPVADGIVGEAVSLLVNTASAARADSSSIVTIGGLTLHPLFQSRLHDALRRAGFTILSPHSDALYGAKLATERFDLPHERYIHRA